MEEEESTLLVEGISVVEEKMSRTVTSRAMRHIRRFHMFNGQPGKSLFIDTDMAQVCAMIQETLDNPDAVEPDRHKNSRVLYKKNFVAVVGVDGRTGASCYCATVVFDQKDNCVVTAFPTV